MSLFLPLTLGTVPIAQNQASENTAALENPMSEPWKKQRAVSVPEKHVPEVKAKEIFPHLEVVCSFLLAPISHRYLSQVFIRQLLLQDLNGTASRPRQFRQSNYME